MQEIIEYIKYVDIVDILANIKGQVYKRKKIS